MHQDLSATCSVVLQPPPPPRIAATPLLGAGSVHQMTDLRLHYKKPRGLIKPAFRMYSPFCGPPPPGLHGPPPNILPATSHCCLQYFHRDCTFVNSMNKALFGDVNGAV